MLRKKTHVVRKKTHVVRKFFYVASIFGGVARRRNRPPWELSSTPWELSSTAGDFSSTASRRRQRLQCVYRAPVFYRGAHTSLPDTHIIQCFAFLPSAKPHLSRFFPPFSPFLPPRVPLVSYFTPRPLARRQSTAAARLLRLVTACPGGVTTRGMRAGCMQVGAESRNFAACQHPYR